MKNIHVIATNKPIKNVGDLVKDQYGDIHIFTKNDGKEYGKTTTKLNIYIASNEEIKEGDWVYHYASHKMFKYDGNGLCVEVEKIILTTDQDLIKDGVQAIDDDFLEWFVKNPSCEEVKVERTVNDYWKKLQLHYEFNYKIIIPQEEPKQETLEEAAEKYWAKQPYNQDAFEEGAKWQQERMYSEEEVKDIVEQTIEKFYKHRYSDKTKSEMKELWFTRFKKK